MENKSKSLYEKAVAEINELSKKTDFSLVKNFHTTKAIQSKLNQTPEVIYKINALIAQEKFLDLVHVRISHSTLGHTITVTDEKGTLLSKENLPSFPIHGTLSLLLIKYKMQHAAYPSYFLIENSFDEK